MRFSSHLICCAVAWLPVGAAPLTPQQREPSARELQLAVSYRELVKKYRDGDRDTVAAAIAIPRIHLESIIKVIFSNDVPGMRWTPGEQRGAAMLHTDAALRVVRLDDDDGEQLERHLTAARRMLHASSAPDNPFVPRWYFAVSRAFRDSGFFRVSEALLERGRTQVPGNPTILYESATVAEALARGYVVTPPEMRAAVRSIETDSQRSVLQRASLLSDAAGWLRDAVERDGTMIMARLHLGRVETLRGREKDGLVHLERVIGATTDDATAYLASLFIGAAHERMRRPEAAEASYRQSIARFPAGQAGYVALSEVLQRSGKTDESRTVLLNLLVGSTREPWWWYLADPPGVAEERLDELRREVRP